MKSRRETLREARTKKTGVSFFCFLDRCAPRSAPLQTFVRSLLLRGAPEQQLDTAWRSKFENRAGRKSRQKTERSSFDPFFRRSMAPPPTRSPLPPQRRKERRPQQQLSYVNKWVSLSASLTALLGAGLSYAFALYAGDLKDRFSYSQAETDGVAAAMNLG